MSQYDVIVLGSGPGGYVAAIRAAQLKMKTALVERDKLGGICLNWGCIPTKALLKSAEIFEEVKHAKSFGLKIEKAEVDFPAVIKRSRVVAETNSKGIEFLMKKNGIDVVYGNGSFKSANTLEIEKDGKKSELSAKHIIIATGGRPRTIPGIDIDGDKVITSKEAMVLEKQPKSLIVMGAGAIGAEFAYFYNSIGTDVTIVEMLDNVLPIEDSEISKVVERNFKKSKIKLHTGTKVESLKKTKTGVEVTVSAKGKSEVLKADKALMAIGIQGNVENLNLEGIGVKNERGFINVNEWYETNVKGVYAIGDIVGPPLLAHVASHEGLVCVEKFAGVETHAVDYNSIPGCTYCQPQVASIGMTEAKAKEAGYELKIGKFPYSASGKARAIGARDGMVKLIFDKKYGELLGAHIVGNEATELIGEIAMAKSLESTPVELAKTMHAHPTLSEMIMEAAADADDEAIHI
ncbi:MAG: dihydrolipoyl dehydrogenase [Calditrichaeota bacterium]|nr:MAG: dihydrolipoyl dehydrogenase [Calditrichota bacterium]MBL1205526.1 dihydrolipoyl dehydrogenase [Calditrichota bacterium]NOG45355.1 dihydrolipoyl dehydrogenase [Calditrichota bacterium]